MSRRLVMYGRTTGCPFITVAKRVLADYGVNYHEIMIDKDDEARQRVLSWTGFLSVPTLVLADEDSVLPIHEPEPLPRGTSPRGIDRGVMITEANRDELEYWLLRNGLIDEIASD